LNPALRPVKGGFMAFSGATVLPTGKALLPLAILFLAAVGVRAFGLPDIGVGGNDTILYYTLAEQWLKGNYVFRIGDSVPLFRPVSLAFNAVALQLFGHTDYAIKLANALVDGCNLLLVASLAWLLSGRAIVAFCSALTYALLPVAIWAARGELPHTLSTFFTLTAMVLALAAVTSDRFWHGLSLLAGLAVAAAVLTHEELVLVAAPLGLFLLYPGAPVDRDRMRRAFTRLGLFAVFPTGTAFLLLANKAAAVKVLAEPAAVTTGQGFYPEVLARFLWNGLSGAGSAFFLLLVGIGFAVFCWTCVRRRGDSDRRYIRAYLFCMGMLLAYLALFAFFLDTIFVRGLLPVLPLAIIAVFYSLAVALARGGRLLSGSALVLIATGLAVTNFGTYSAFKVSNRGYSQNWDVPQWPDWRGVQAGFQGFLFDAAYQPSYYTYWGKVHDALSGKVDAENRVLLLPSTAIYSPGRRPLQTGVYFGDDVIYRLDHSDMTIDELVADYRVRYIVFALGQRRRAPKTYTRYLYEDQWAAPVTVDLARDYGMDRYSEQAEFYQVMHFVNAVGARPLALFPEGSYEAANTRVWALP
jgi:hypothetical protein